MVIVFYTDLRIFWAARDGDKLGQHRERDILSGAGPATGNLRWSQGVRSSEVQTEMESVAHKQSGKERKVCVCEWSCTPALHPHYSQCNSRYK